MHEDRESTTTISGAGQTPVQLKPRKNTLESLVRSKVSNCVSGRESKIHFHLTASLKLCFNITA